MNLLFVPEVLISSMLVLFPDLCVCVRVRVCARARACA
jgi:hypothetical protein